MLDIKEVISMSQGLKVLYVEDNEEARESTLGLLENIFNHITIAVNGKDGLEKFHQESSSYDLIISDINMPKMNGADMVRVIKQTRKDIKIFLLSAYDESEYPEDAEIKIDARLHKPMNFNSFLEELKKIYSKDTKGLSI